MRILVHDRSGHAFPVQLSRELARRGYQVLHSHGAFFQTPKGDLVKKATDPMGFSIESIELDKPFQKYSLFKRHFQEIEYARRFVNQIQRFDPEILILAQMTPDAQAFVYKQLRGTNKKIIFWVQDIYGIAIKRILSKRMPVIGNLIGNYYIWQEKRLLRRSDKVVLITEDFNGLMDKWSIDYHKRSIIHNWTPLDDLPVCSKENSWAQRHNLEDKFSFLYAGTLGLKHNPGLLLKLACHFRENEEVRVVVISEGLGADWLRERKKAYGLTNLHLLDFQPFDLMQKVLGSADVLMAILEPDAGVYSAPSKVLTYLCAERALLLAIPSENLSARIVSDYNAGIVVSPENDKDFIAGADKLLSDSRLRRTLALNARNYAETHFEIKTIGDQFEKVILG